MRQFVRLLGILLVPASLFAIDSKASRQSLKGLAAMNVTVELAEPEMQKIGIDTGKIKSAVETKLKAAGIKVLSEDERVKTPGAPHLSVSLNAMKGKDATVSFGFTVALYQSCALARDPNMKVPACDTWSKSRVGHGNNNVPAFIDGLIASETDLFLKAYAEANPHK